MFLNMNPQFVILQDYKKKSLKSLYHSPIHIMIPWKPNQNI